MGAAGAPSSLSRKEAGCPSTRSLVPRVLRHVSRGRISRRLTVIDPDEKRLHELGYAQELHRGMGWFSNFAVSFTIISILSGGITTYYLGMVAGGPRIIIWGWLFVGGMVMLVGAGMAEVCSSFPTAGGLYYWAAKLAPQGKAPVWSWFTGWFNLLGQVAVTASIDFAMATFTRILLEPDDRVPAAPQRASSGSTRWC